MAQIYLKRRRHIHAYNDGACFALYLGRFLLQTKLLILSHPPGFFPYIFHTALLLAGPNLSTTTICCHLRTPWQLYQATVWLASKINTPITLLVSDRCYRLIWFGASGGHLRGTLSSPVQIPRVLFKSRQRVYFLGFWPPKMRFNSVIWKTRDFSLSPVISTWHASCILQNFTASCIS